jgi:hypothetical protein
MTSMPELQKLFMLKAELVRRPDFLELVPL